MSTDFCLASTDSRNKVLGRHSSKIGARESKLQCENVFMCSGSVGHDVEDLPSTSLEQLPLKADIAWGDHSC